MRFLLPVLLLLAPLFATAQSDAPSQKKDWRIWSCDSFEPGNGIPQNVIDGDLQSHWHSHWSRNEVPQHPHEIAVDMGKAVPLAGFIYVPRPNGGDANGRIDRFQYLTSSDGTNWAQAARGRFAPGPTTQTNLFAQTVTARYFKLVSWSAFNNGPWACVAELDVVPAKP